MDSKDSKNGFNGFNDLRRNWNFPKRRVSLEPFWIEENLIYKLIQVNTDTQSSVGLWLVFGDVMSL